MSLYCSTEHSFTITAARICLLNDCRVNAAKLIFVMLVVALVATQAEGFNFDRLLDQGTQLASTSKYCFYYPPLQRHMSQTLTHAL